MMTRVDWFFFYLGSFFMIYAAIKIDLLVGLMAVGAALIVRSGRR